MCASPQISANTDNYTDSQLKFLLRNLVENDSCLLHEVLQHRQVQSEAEQVRSSLPVHFLTLLFLLPGEAPAAAASSSCCQETAHFAYDGTIS
jgi:hypothetical protein